MDNDFLNQCGWMVDTFDFDGDGEIDDVEAMFVLNSFGVMAETKTEDEERLAYELAASGVDLVSFDLMDEEGKREAIEDAGLDPDDYDLDL